MMNYQDVRLVEHLRYQSTQATTQVMRDRFAEAAARIEETTQQKPAWQSVTMWSGFVTFLVSLARQFGADTTGFNVDTVVNAIIALAGVGAMIGRMRASKRIVPLSEK